MDGDEAPGPLGRKAFKPTRSAGARPNGHAGGESRGGGASMRHRPGSPRLGLKADSVSPSVCILRIRGEKNLSPNGCAAKRL